MRVTLRHHQTQRLWVSLAHRLQGGDSEPSTYEGRGWLQTASASSSTAMSRPHSRWFLTFVFHCRRQRAVSITVAWFGIQTYSSAPGTWHSTPLDSRLNLTETYFFSSFLSSLLGFISSIYWFCELLQLKCYEMRCMYVNLFIECMNSNIARTLFPKGGCKTLAALRCTPNAGTLNMHNCFWKFQRSCMLRYEIVFENLWLNLET